MNGALPSKTPLAPPRVSILTINWNSYGDTARLLGSLRRLTYPSFDVIVVDNGSTDGSLEKLRADYPEVTVLPLPDNTGFGAANNAALRRVLEANIPFAWLINNDAFPEPTALDSLVARLQAVPKAGAAGGIVVEDTPPGGIQAWGGGRIHPWLGYARSIVSADETPEFLTGACLLLRTAALREVGLFDERFFLYWEDTDLCFRLREAGWLLTVAETRIHHTGSASTGRFPRKRAFHILRSFALLMHLHARWPRAKSFSAACFQSLGKALAGNGPAAAGCWEGWRAGRAACGRPDCPRRKARL
jgi:GT2 family glycosyltransferase